MWLLVVILILREKKPFCIFIKAIIPEMFGENKQKYNLRRIYFWQFSLLGKFPYYMFTIKTRLNRSYVHGYMRASYFIVL